MDMVPGAVTFFWFTPTRTGTFDVLCFELCGVGHHMMRGYVVVEEESAYRAWLQEQSTFAQSLADATPGTEEGLNLVVSAGEANSTPEGLAR